MRVELRVVMRVGKGEEMKVEMRMEIRVKFESGIESGDERGNEGGNKGGYVGTKSKTHLIQRSRGGCRRPPRQSRSLKTTPSTRTTPPSLPPASTRLWTAPTESPRGR